MMDFGRKTTRRNTFVLGTVTTPEGELITECFVRDISDSGARLQLRKDVPLPGSFVLALSKDGMIVAHAKRYGNSPSSPGVFLGLSTVLHLAP